MYEKRAGVKSEPKGNSLHKKIPGVFLLDSELGRIAEIKEGAVRNGKAGDFYDMEFSIGGGEKIKGDVLLYQLGVMIEEIAKDEEKIDALLKIMNDKDRKRKKSGSSITKEQLQKGLRDTVTSILEKGFIRVFDLGKEIGFSVNVVYPPVLEEYKDGRLDITKGFVENYAGKIDTLAALVVHGLLEDKRHCGLTHWQSCVMELAFTDGWAGAVPPKISVLQNIYLDLAYERARETGDSRFYYQIQETHPADIDSAFYNRAREQYSALLAQECFFARRLCREGYLTITGDKISPADKLIRIRKKAGLVKAAGLTVELKEKLGGFYIAGISDTKAGVKEVYDEDGRFTRYKRKRQSWEDKKDSDSNIRLAVFDYLKKIFDIDMELLLSGKDENGNDKPPLKRKKDLVQARSILTNYDVLNRMFPPIRTLF